MSRIIVSSLLSELRAAAGRRVEPLNIINVLRLLDMYKTDAFRSRTPLGILEREPNELGDYRPDGLERLKAAIKAAHLSVAAGVSASEFADNLHNILKPLLSDSDVANVNSANIADADRFLSELLILLARS